MPKNDEAPQKKSRKKSTEKQAEAQRLIRTKLNAEKRMTQIAERASILFADLVGSTAYKLDRDPLDALTPALEHHDLVAEIAKEEGGEVIKSMGDGILIMFKNEQCERHAIMAGLKVLESLGSSKVGSPARLQTSIGIHSGPVWMFGFPHSSVEDPQGTTVDVASRLCSLAGPQQLVASKETVDEAGVVHFKNIGKEYQRYLKGLRTPIAVRMILPEGPDWKLEKVPVSGYRWALRPDAKKRFRKACDLLLKGDPPSIELAIDGFKEIVEGDPGCFEGHYGMSRSLLSPHRRSERELEKIKNHLCTARQAHPRYYGVWLLVGWERFLMFKHRGNEIDDLERAVDYTETAIEYAAHDLDSNGIIRGKLQLARLKLSRALFDGEENDGACLQQAAQLCLDLEPVLKGQSQQYESELLLTNGLIQIAQAGNEGSLKEVEQTFKQALEDDPDNPELLLRGLADVAVKRRELRLQSAKQD